MDRALIDAIAAHSVDQHGLVSLAQLSGLGVTRRQRRNLVDDGWLVAVVPGVHRLAGAPETVEQRLTAGLLSLGAGTLVSHEAAARLHGFDRCLDDAVEFTVLRSRRNAGGPFVVHSTREIGPVDRVRVGGFPCTSATRTILDLARSRIPIVRLEAAIDSAVRSGATSPVVLAARLTSLRGRGRWGVPDLDMLLETSGGHTQLERRFLQLLQRHRLPRPSTQVVHRRHGRTAARVDFLFDEYGIVVEVSGRRGHASDAERARDAQRRNELQDLGRRVYEYTFHQVVHEQAEVARSMLARFGGQRVSNGALRSGGPP